MRVLHLGAGNLFGGVERTLLTLWQARHACPRMRPHFALCFDARLADELRRTQAPLTICGPASAGNPFSVWRARRRLRACLREGAFDVAVAHGFWAQVVLGPAARRMGVRLVTWAHDVPTPRDRWARLAAGRAPDLLLANSRYTAARAAEMFGSTGRSSGRGAGRGRREPACEVHVQYPPVQFDACGEDTADTLRDAARRDVRDSLGAPPQALVVLIAARLQPGKGHEVLIDALSRLGDGIDWRCWIAGAPQRPVERVYQQVIENLISAAGIEPRVRLLGHREDVPRLLAAADVMCQPNTAPEGFGLTFVEAMAAGAAVVTSDLGAAAELIDDRSGLLVRPGDPAAVAQALARIARAWRRDGASRRRAIELCGAEHALPRLAATLERAMAR